MSRSPSGRVLPALLAILLALPALLAPGLIITPAANAAAANQTLDIVLLGDSYSAGNGAGSYYGPQGSYRSRNNWAHRYTAWLNGQGVSTTLTNLARSGSITDSVLTQQVPAIPAGTDLVMLTIGGNDADFAGIVQQCFAIGVRDPRGCKKKVDGASASLPTVKAQTRRILEAIDARLPDGAQVVLVGYPRLANDRPYVLKSFFTSYDAGTGVRGLSDSSRRVQAALVQEWNASHPGLQVTYVDTVISAFSGHEPDPSVTSRNDKRWLNEFLETEGRLGADGRTTSIFSADPNNWYHPNIIGHEQIANLIVTKLGIPNAVQPANRAADLDIALVVNTTGDMQDDISAVSAEIGPIMEQVETQTASARFAVVEYADTADDDTGEVRPGAQTVVDFTDDASTVEAALDTLTVQAAEQPEPAGDTSPDLGLSWREGTQKITLVLGDAAGRTDASDEPPAPAAESSPDDDQGDPQAVAIGDSTEAPQAGDAANAPDTGDSAPAPNSDGAAQAAAAGDDATVTDEAARAGDDVAAAAEAATEAAAATAGEVSTSVYGIDTGQLDSPELRAMVEDSGGTLVRADSPEAIAELVTAAIDAELAKPFAWIQGPYVAAVGDTIEFDAAGSYSPSGSIVSYEWDLDGDGIFDEVTASPTVTHAYADPFDGEVGLRVTQADGSTATTTAAVTVTDDGDTTAAEVDNCPDIANEGQSDHDGDGIGDECDVDPGYPTVDRLGVCVVGETCPSSPPASITAPGSPADAAKAGRPDESDGESSGDGG